MIPATGRVFPLFQPAIPRLQQELQFQRDSWPRSLQAQWSELELSQA
jgi:hypothetical protein